MFRSIPAPGRPWFWLGCALVIKGLLFWHMLGQPYVSSTRAGALAVCSGDCETYLRPVDHLIDHGSYAPDDRMPGYGAIYWMTRSLFADGALSVMVVLQLLADVLACWVLAWGVFKLIGSLRAFLVCFLLYTVGCTVSDFDRFILTESLAASSLVFAFGCAMRHRSGGGPLWLGAASLFLVWSYFMRPVLLPVFLLVAAVVLIALLKRRSYRAIAIFFAPFLLIQGAWTLRNHAQKGKWYLLTETRYLSHYPQFALEGWTFAGTFDDMKKQHFYPDPGWPDRSVGEAYFRSLTFPDDIYTPEFDLDSLRRLQADALALRFDHLDARARTDLEQRFIERARRYTSSMKEHHPFITRVRTPWRLSLRHVFGSSGVQNLYKAPFSELGTPARALKLFFIGVYLLALYGSLMFIAMALRRWRSRPLELLLACLLVYGLLVHPVIIRTADVRYLYVFYPLMCLCASLFLGRLWERFAGPGRGMEPATSAILAP